MPAQKRKKSIPQQAAAPVVEKIVTAKQRRIAAQTEAAKRNKNRRANGEPTPWQLAREARRARRAHLQWATPGPLGAQSPEFQQRYKDERAARRRLASK